MVIDLCNCSSQVCNTCIFSRLDGAAVCRDDLDEGGTITSVASTSRLDILPDLVDVLLSLEELFPCTSNAIMLRDFPKPIESASMPPLNDVGSRSCVDPLTLL